jgi:DNA modification methylase
VKIADIKIGKRVRQDIGDLDDLCRSIEEVGLLQPVVVNPELELVAGRRRIEAFKKLGRTDIPATVAKTLADALLKLKAERDENTCRKPFTPSEAVAMGEKLEGFKKPEAEAAKKDGHKKGGKTAGRGRPKPTQKVAGKVPTSNGRVTDQVAPAVGMKRKTYEKAKAVVAAAKKHPEVFAPVVAKMNETGNVNAAFIEVKRQEKREELKVKAETAQPAPADSWQVLTGDCVAELAKVEPGTIRLVFADPPYNIGFDYGEGHDDEQPDDQYLTWVASWVAGCADALAPDGSMWVLINDEYAAEYALLLKRAGLTIRNWVIWYETFGVNCANKFNRTKRHLFYTVKNPDRFVFHPDAVSRPSDRQAKYNDARANPDGKILDDVWTDIPRLVGTAAERIPDFPTQLPLALLRRVVACSSDPGDLVIDPFNGSGTTGAACVELGRRYLGIERSEKFAELARLRLKGVRPDATGI